MNKTSFLALFTFVFLLLFLVSCSVAQPSGNTPSNQKENNQKEVDNNEKIVDKNEAKEEEKNNQQGNVGEEEKVNKEEKENLPQYYVNENYFIKPVNENDSKQVVLLTFDDAPQGEQTKVILNVLDKHNAKAIFFINGHYAVKNKELLKEIYDRGHMIGNHTWWHENLKKIDLEKTKTEIIDVNNLVEEVTGTRPVYFRPPFGVMSPIADQIVAEEKMQRMNWSLGSLDWEYFKPEQKEKVISQVIDNITPGANILMHDKEVTSLALDEMLTKLEEKGFSFVLPTEVKY